MSTTTSGTTSGTGKTTADGHPAADTRAPAAGRITASGVFTFVDSVEPQPGRWAAAAARIRKTIPAGLRPGAVLAWAVLAVVLAWAVVPQLFTGYNPLEGSDAGLLAPSATHWFGTDAVGRDVYARVVYGTRWTVLGALLAVSVGLAVGTVLGAVAGTKRGIVDSVIMRAVDVLLSIPGLLLALSVIVILGFGTINAAIAVGVTSIATFTRLTRSQVISVAHSDYVEAAYASGGTFRRVLVDHIIPNSLGPVLALAAVQLGSAILQLSILGFLGYGAPPPTPEWGLIIANSRDYVATAWWLTVIPGAVIVAVVLSTNYLKETLR